MNTAMLTAKLEDMSKEDLIKLVLTLSIDSTFKLMNRDIAKLFCANIVAGKELVFIDLANMHGLNHKYGMDNADTFINNVLSYVRHTDTWIRWGSDEIVCILDSGNALDLIDTLHAAMTENNLYAVYGIVKTSDNLCESIKRADTIVMAAKAQLEKLGLKAARDEEYTVKESVVVTE